VNKKKILFISKGAHAASTRYRALVYFNILETNGWHPVHMTARHNLLSRMRLLHRALSADVVVVLRKTFGNPFLRLLRICSKHLIFDLDDAIFCNSNGSVSRRRENRFAQMARNCQQVWAGNLYLNEIAGRHNGSVITLPTSLTIDKYIVDTKKPDDHIDLVWIGSGSTQRYLEEALPILERLADRLPCLRLKIVADFDLPSQRLNTLAVRWSENRESKQLSSAHIGIAPMPDNAWTRGKCGLKVLQYMAAGLPVVSSPSGVNGKIVEHGVNGFLAEGLEEWQVAIGKLAPDPDLRKMMGETGRRIVVEHYSVEETCCKMLEALEALS